MQSHHIQKTTHQPTHRHMKRAYVWVCFEAHACDRRPEDDRTNCLAFAGRAHDPIPHRMFSNFAIFNWQFDLTLKYNALWRSFAQNKFQTLPQLSTASHRIYGWIFDVHLTDHQALLHLQIAIVCVLSQERLFMNIKEYDRKFFIITSQVGVDET